jgi:uncharacterized membrane protein (DUF4010 family)
MFETARPFLLALAIGLLIGIERERAKSDATAEVALGSRTFALLALLGAAAAFVADPTIAVVLAAFAAAVILAGYLKAPVDGNGAGVGVTTEVAGMATFALGYLARSAPWLTCMLAVIVLALLALKPRIHAFAKAGIHEKEVSAALTFLVIAFVVLPLLPHHAVDPWGLLNPARLWVVLVVIAGISFGGYIAVRLLGPGWGLPVAGFSAGLVSSTAATLSLAQKSREDPALTGPAAVGVVLANTASATAQILVVAAVYPLLVVDVLPVIGLAVLAGALGASVILLPRFRGGAGNRFEIGNPLAFRAAASFAAVLAVVLIAVSLASRVFGPSGLLVTSAIGGATDVHAVTLAVSNLAAAENLEPRPAVLAILVAFMANMIVKMGLAAWAGGMRFAWRVWPPLAVMAGAAVAGFLLL